MKNKLLSFIFAICLIIPCGIMLTACGENPPGGGGHTHNWDTTYTYNSASHWLTCNSCDEKKNFENHNIVNGSCSVCGYVTSHTHSWPNTFQKDATGHWKECSTCGAESAKADHDYENNVCQNCGYENPNAGLEMVSSVRDLEIITYDTGASGVFTLVCLPDGKNMVIDAGNEGFDTNMLVEDKLLYTYGLSTIDYFVLTNTNAARTGQASYIVQNFEVKNFYTPREINNSASTCYKSALANTPNTCNVVEVGESNCDITRSFRDEQNTYTYTIDFMLPVETSDCVEDLDASIAISIEYAGKKVLISGDATEKTIHGYYDKYNGQKDVDILITSYLYTYPYAIVNSESNGKDYLASISLDENDRVIIYSIAENTRVNDLVDCFFEAGLPIVNNIESTATVTITSLGVVNVTAE